MFKLISKKTFTQVIANIEKLKKTEMSSSSIQTSLYILQVLVSFLHVLSPPSKMRNEIIAVTKKSMSQKSRDNVPSQHYRCTFKTFEHILVGDLSYQYFSR